MTDKRITAALDTLDGKTGTAICVTPGSDTKKILVHVQQLAALIRQLSIRRPVDPINQPWVGRCGSCAALEGHYDDCALIALCRAINGERP